MNLYEEDEIPVIGVPLGLALLLVTLLAMCGVFICCLYWDRIPIFAQPPHDLHYPPTHNIKPSSHHLNKVESLPVMMPGDQVPSFIAMSCPCNKPPPPPAAALEIIVQLPDKPPVFTFPPPPPLF
ncbi:Uncharacterized protein At5g65660 [Linum grandiflorum]